MSTSSESESSGSRCTNNELKRIIIDTDPGVDDAMAIMLALHAHIQGRLEIVAITLVKGNVPIKDAERNILRVLEVFELEDKIPIYVGSEYNLVVEAKSDNFFGEDGFNDVKFYHTPDVSKIKRDEMAHQAILRYTSEYPGHISVVALGPLTTIATCVISDPTFGSRLDTLFIMGGSSDAKGNVTINAEFNFWFDAEAAHVVINRANCVMKIVPWETCIEKKIDWEWRLDDLGNIDTPQAILMNSIEEPISSKKKADDQYMGICDQICMAVAIDEKCSLKSTKYKATVELQGTHARGMMAIDKRYWLTIKEKNVEMIDSVDIDLVKSLMKSAFGHT